MKHLALFLLLAAGIPQAAISLSGVEIYSNERVQYGRWEIRMKAAATPGSVSSFFTYDPNSYRGTPYPWSEIDIEVLGNRPAGFQSNMITGYASNKTMSEIFHTADSDISQGFHTYTLDWTPDSIVWRLDGVRLRAATGAQVTALRDSSETYRMNLWASSAEGWVGALDTAKLPVLQIINWVTYSSYTPSAGPDGSDFTQSWTDDFNTINNSRWSFGDWTFDENYATFTKLNAKAINGYLVMMLSTKSQKGIFPDTLPTDSLGSARPTSGITAGNGKVSALSVRAPGSGRLELDLPRGGATVCDSQGRILARTAASGLTTFSGLPHGIAFVHARSVSRSVFIN